MVEVSTNELVPQHHIVPADDRGSGSSTRFLAQPPDTGNWRPCNEPSDQGVDIGAVAYAFTDAAVRMEAFGLTDVLARLGCGRAHRISSSLLGIGSPATGHATASCLLLASAPRVARACASNGINMAAQDAAIRQRRRIAE